MAQIRQTGSMAHFQAASGIDPATLRETIAALVMATILIWSAHYVRRLMTNGWGKMDRIDLANIGAGLFLVIVLFFFVLWTLANIGPGS